MKILVIEDNQKHLEDAHRFLTSLKEVEVIYARTFRAAKPHLEPGVVDGVISDIYFPLDSPYSDYGQEEAIGVAVMILCRERKIPCVLNTSGYHHGKRYQWIFELLNALEHYVLIESGRWDQKHAEADSKNWELAFTTLRNSITAEPITGGREPELGEE